MKKFLSLILITVIGLIGLMPVGFAEGDVKITLDVNERYTDIGEKEDGDIYLNDPQYEEEKKEIQNRKTAYIVVLSVLLVIAVVVLVYTLKKAPKEDEIEDKNGNIIPQTRLQRDIGSKVRRENKLMKDELKAEEKESDK